MVKLGAVDEMTLCDSNLKFAVKSDHSEYVDSQHRERTALL